MSKTKWDVAEEPTINNSFKFNNLLMLIHELNLHWNKT